MLRYWKETTAYRNDVHLLPKLLDEKVPTLHLPALGGVLTVPTVADFIVVEVKALSRVNTTVIGCKV